MRAAQRAAPGLGDQRTSEVRGHHFSRPGWVGDTLGKRDGICSPALKIRLEQVVMKQGEKAPLSEVLCHQLLGCSADLWKEAR